MNIPPCTTGKHSTVDDTPAPEPKPAAEAPQAKQVDSLPAPAPRVPQAAQQAATPKPSAPPAPPEDESDDPDATVPANATCKRKNCGVTYNGGARDDEECTHHPGQPIFHEGSKGWTCCKRRVLEFDDFLRMPGCKTKKKHLFVGSKKEGVEMLDTVRQVMAVSRCDKHRANL